RLIFPTLAKRFAAGRIAAEIVRQEFEELVEIRERVFPLFAILVNLPANEIRLGILGVQRDGSIEVSEGGGCVTELVVKQAAFAESSGFLAIHFANVNGVILNRFHLPALVGIQLAAKQIGARVLAVVLNGVAEIAHGFLGTAFFLQHFGPDNIGFGAAPI